MRHKKIMILGFLLPFLFVNCKKDSPSLASEYSDPNDLPNNNGARALEVKFVPNEDENQNHWGYDSIVGYRSGWDKNFISSGNQEFPNGEFKEWVDRCWMWGYNKAGSYEKVGHPMTVRESQFREFFKNYTFVNKQDGSLDCEALPDELKKNLTFYGKSKTVRWVPQHFLSAVYAQIYNSQRNAYLFNGAAIGFAIGNSVQEQEASPYIRPLSGDNENNFSGIRLESVEGKGAAADKIVNGQITTGIARVAGPTQPNAGMVPSAGFIQTVGSIPNQGKNNDEVLGNYRFTDRPKAMKVVVNKFTYKNAKDKGIVEIMLHENINATLPLKTRYEVAGVVTTQKVEQQVGTNAIAYARLVLTDKIENEQTITIPIFWKDDSSKPNYLLANIVAGDGYDALAGTVLEIKSIEFEY